MKRKLKPWRAEKCEPRICVNNAPTVTNRRTYRSRSSPYGAVRWNSRKFAAKVNLSAGFAQTKIAYQRKAKAMESWKCKPGGYANNAQTVTKLQTYRSRAWPYGPVSGNSRKFDAKVNLGAGFAPTQIAHEEKAKGMEGWKNANPGCVQTTHQRLRTSKHISVLHLRIWPPVEIHAKVNLAAGSAPSQMAYQRQAKDMESWKMQTWDSCKQRTNGYEPENISVSFIAV